MRAIDYPVNYTVKELRLLSIAGIIDLLPPLIGVLICY
jgi:hypothetical protein